MPASPLAPLTPTALFAHYLHTYEGGKIKGAVSPLLLSTVNLKATTTTSTARTTKAITYKGLVPPY